MRNYEPPKGPIQGFATLLFLVGVGVYFVVDDVPWIGIGMMLAGIMLSISLLFAQWRRDR